MEIILKNCVLTQQNGWIKKCTNTSPTNYATATAFCPDYPIAQGVMLEKIKVVTTSTPTEVTILVIEFDSKPVVGSIGRKVGESIVVTPTDGVAEIDVLGFGIVANTPFTYIAVVNGGFTDNGDDVVFGLLDDVNPQAVEYVATASNYKALSLGYR